MNILRLTYKSLKYTFIPFLGLVLLYFVIALFFSLIPVNREQNKKNTDYPIYLSSNGVHLDIVLPYNDSLSDWNKLIPFDSQVLPYVKYIGFGWGDKQFYINTPTWRDLTLSTAFSAAFLKGESAMHISPYNSITENDHTIQLYLTKDEYMCLIKYILDSFKTSNEGGLIEIEGASFARHDKFFKANRSYHLFYTCNSWVNQGLKKTGVQSCLWTPFDKGIFYQVKKSGDQRRADE